MSDEIDPAEAARVLRFIKDAAREAVAEAIYLEQYGADGGVWEAVEPRYQRTVWMRRAEAALAALAPFIEKRVAAAKAEGMREAAGIARKAWPRAHTYASENADMYHAQDYAVERVIAAILAAIPKEPSHDR